MQKALLAAVLGLSLATLSPARAQDQSDLLTQSLTISTGQSVDLKSFAEEGVVNVYVFYNATSSADRALVDNIMTRRRGSNMVGVHLVRLPDLNAPIAKQYAVTETPLVIVHDRFGRETTRTSKVEELLPAVNRAMKLARLKWVDEADPKAAEVYKNLLGGRERVPEILKTMSLQPEWMDSIDKLSSIAHFSDTALPRRTKEMIATYVSGINRCKY